MALHKEIAIQAFEMLVSRGEAADGIHMPRLTALIPTACEVLAKRVLNSPDYHGMQTAYNVTATSGIVDFSGYTGSFTDMLFDLYKSRVLNGSTLQPITPIDDLVTMIDGGLPEDKQYFTMSGPRLHIRNAPPSTPYSGQVLIYANYIPDVVFMPPRYDGALVLTVAELYQRKGASAVEEASRTGVG